MINTTNRNAYLLAGKLYIPYNYLMKNHELFDIIKKYCICHVPYRDRQMELKFKTERFYEIETIEVNSKSIKCYSLPPYWVDYDNSLIPEDDLIDDEVLMDAEEKNNLEKIKEFIIPSVQNIWKSFSGIIPNIINLRVKNKPIPFLLQQQSSTNQQEKRYPQDPLYENQEIIYTNIMDSLGKYGGATAVVPTGRGKTKIGMHVINEVKQKTLVIVHMRGLCEYWCVEVMNSFHNKLKVCILNKNTDISKYDVIISTYQGIISQPREKFANEIGFLIVDEAHHIAAKYLREILNKVNCNTLALTATPERIDGRTNFVYWGLGPCCYYEEPVFTIPTTLYEMNINVNPKDCCKRVKTMCARDINKHLIEDDDRSKIIASWFNEGGEFSQKHCLIFVDEVAHVKKLCELIKGSQSYIGSNRPVSNSSTTTAKKRKLNQKKKKATKRKKPEGSDEKDPILIDDSCDENEDEDEEEVTFSTDDIELYHEFPYARVVIATYSAFGEGKNNPEFEIVCFAMLRPRLVQPVGRGVRESRILLNKTVGVVCCIDTIFDKIKKKYKIASRYLLKKFTNLTIKKLQFQNKNLSYNLINKQLAFQLKNENDGGGCLPLG